MQCLCQWNKTISGNQCFHFENSAKRSLISLYFWEMEPNHYFPSLISIFISPAWVTEICNSNRLYYRPGSLWNVATPQPAVGRGAQAQLTGQSEAAWELTAVLSALLPYFLSLSHLDTIKGEKYCVKVVSTQCCRRKQILRGGLSGIALWNNAAHDTIQPIIPCQILNTPSL